MKISSVSQWRRIWDGVIGGGAVESEGYIGITLFRFIKVSRYL